MPLPASGLSRGALIRYWLSDRIIRALIAVALLVPYRWRVPAMGWIVSRLVAPLAGLRKRIRDNLALTCPELPAAEVERLVRAVPDNAGRTLIEFYSGRPFLERAYAAPVVGPGLAALKEARAKGRPVVLITGHFGNYDVLRANLFRRGHPMGAIYRRMANPYFNAHYTAAIKAIGEPMWEQGRRGMMEMVRHLKNGGIIAIAADLHVHGGKELTFFGQPAISSVVSAELALKHDALLIPIYVVRQPNGLDFEIEMHAPIPHTDPETMTQAVQDDLEELVRRHMDQWFWIHRRWKP
ncbi:lysophospholipid acyltransferase family protein [Seohaeicola zhoushanensis]|uniref:Lauroyl acyltransferase n=1 Tax=Seohaeicola zhoushanensis TaxID=1569283 RepID=A0A8J3GXQ5_9RHOB|nr:lysophospholipid acyltransferase family protein [Seohaeicola zhoushanensis]GHF50867.1 lauroyl acyltransferase [Seohaeicola zhoushanensis]